MLDARGVVDSASSRTLGNAAPAAVGVESSATLSTYRRSEHVAARADWDRSRALPSLAPWASSGLAQPSQPEDEPVLQTNGTDGAGPGRFGCVMRAARAGPGVGAPAPAVGRDADGRPAFKVASQVNNLGCIGWKRSPLLLMDTRLFLITASNLCDLSELRTTSNSEMLTLTGERPMSAHPEQT